MYKLVLASAYIVGLLEIFNVLLIPTTQIIPYLAWIVKNGKYLWIEGEKKYASEVPNALNIFWYAESIFLSTVSDISLVLQEVKTAYIMHTGVLEISRKFCPKTWRLYWLLSVTNNLWRGALVNFPFLFQENYFDLSPVS